jgi:hypothetical protein
MGNTPHRHVFSGLRHVYVTLNRLEPKVLTTYLAEWYLSDPTKGMSRYNTCRTAFRNYWKDQMNSDLPENFKIELQHFFKGLKRKIALEKRSGTRVSKEGKYPIPFALFKWLCT